MTTAAPARFPIRMIPIALIDEPELAMRETMSDAGLESLTESLRTLGQLEPIGVREHGDRFEVIYGHRRRIAGELAGLESLECKVYPSTIDDAEARKVAENAEQEAVNPVGEATYYEHLFNTRCNHDVEAVARLVGKPLSRILDRLDLLRGDAAVRQALRDDRIAHAVARELNKVKDDGYRALFLADAIRDGSNSTAVKHRRQELERTLRYNQVRAQLEGEGSAPSIAPSVVTIDACAICLLGDDEHEMEYVRVHRSCRAAHAREVKAGATAPGGRS